MAPLTTLLTESSSFITTATAAAGWALVSHLIFKSHEPRLVPLLVCIIIALLALPASAGLHRYNSSYPQPALSMVVALTTYSVTITCSIVCYRLYLSPLRRFPGPRMAALTKWWHFSLVMSGQTPDVIERLHNIYGDIVRTGPNEISIRNIDAIHSIMGNKARLDKGPWYAALFMKKGTSIGAIRDVETHAIRRRYWDKAFSGRALQQYAVYIKEMGNEFCAVIRKEAESGPLDLSKWISVLTFDVMGEFTFGKSFGMLKTGKRHFLLTFADKAMKVVATFGEVPWIMPFLGFLPGGAEAEDMYNFSMESTLKRLNRGQKKHDIFSYLIEEDGALHPNFTMGDLDAEVRAAILAGSDTTASVLTFLFEFLSHHPSMMRELQHEADLWFHKESNFTELATLPILNAVINETMRVRPVIPSRSQRIVPAGGIEISGHYIPGGTMVGVPQRAVMCDERYFSPEPQVWRPDRWLQPETEIAMDPKAFFPFSVGPFNCPGRLLALLELRIFVLQIALAFDIEPAPQHDRAKFECSIVDYFAVQKGSFYACVKPRDRSGVAV